MKSISLSLLITLALLFTVSCKNDIKQDETQETATDTIAKETTPDYLYVTAVSGLTVRKEPNLQSEKLAVMPLGTKVKILNPETKTTMTVGGIVGAMDQVEYNGMEGYAFNGFMSPFPSPPAQQAVAKTYAEDLKQVFPQAEYSESTGGTASKPTKTQVLLLPTSKWHEAFFMAQQLYGIPHQFAFPNPRGANSETQINNNRKPGDLTNELHISRNNNTLQKIEYTHKTRNFGYTVSVTQEGDRMRIERVETMQ